MQTISFTFDKLNLKKWYYVNFKVNKLPDKHIVDRYLEAVDVFDVHNDQQGLDYFIPRQDEVNLQELTPAFGEGFVGFAIGARHYTKKLPNEKIVAIIEKMELPVVLLGGGEDYDNGEVIASRCTQHVYNACGKYSVNQSASLVKQARAVITHDTGLMHVAAAFKKKIISVWGNTVPEFGMYPYKPHPESQIFEIRGLNCRPCTKIGYSRCPKKHFKCMIDQDEAAIALKVQQFFNSE
jgi:ADP-heptose:LPS heptosyltransferase